jgi:hypothetical protein
MVENFLTNPNLTDARQETGTTSLSVNQIQPVSDPGVCQQLGADYSSLRLGFLQSREQVFRDAFTQAIR